MPLYESGRRLCLLVEAGETRLAIEATSVVEVAPAAASGHTLRGVLEVRDLSVLLGGPPEPGPGMVVVLDVSPTLAVRVRRIVEVADVARAPFFQLPPGLGEGLATVGRGAVLHGERLYLELAAEALPARLGHPPRPPPLRAVYLMDVAPDRALVLECQGRAYGVPLALVSQVVQRSPAYSPLPLAEGPVAGVFPHAQVLWPVTSPPALLGERAVAEEWFVLTELAGQSVGLAAGRVLGVHPRFMPTPTRGEFTTPGVHGPVLFLDLQRMFS